MLYGSILSIISGVLIALSFPKYNLAFLIWFAFVPLFFAISREKLRKSVFFAFAAGMAANLIKYYWLVATCVGDGLSVFFGISVLAVLAVYLSLYYAVFGAFCNLFYNKLFVKEKYLLFILAAASLWAVLEYARAHLLTGFPWMLLGHSAWENILLIQMADITGVYGLSFVIMFFNLSILVFFKNRFCLKYIAIASAVVVVCLLYGWWMKENIARSKADPADIIKVSLLQISVDQYKKWDDRYEREVFASCKELIEQSAADNPHLIVWPETSIPYVVSSDGIKADRWIRELITPGRANHLVGTVVLEGGKLFNSAYMVGPDMNIYGRYDKVHLLPFGEFIPFEKFLTKLIQPLNRLGGFRHGSVLEPVYAGAHKAGVTICYESIFPYISRRLSKNGARFLLNLTNDAWFFRTSAPYQHLSMNVFRAVENRMNLARCANTGISAFIGPDGRINGSTALFEKTVLTGEIKLVHFGRTFYQRYGDIFALILVVFSGIITGLCMFDVVKPGNRG